MREVISDSWHFFRETAKALKTPALGFERLRVIDVDSIGPRCLTKRGAVGELIFVPPKFFSFFPWGVIRPISPHPACASRLLIGGWPKAVGRNCLNFAPGVGQNSSRVGQNSRCVPAIDFDVPHQVRKIRPTYFRATDAIRTRRNPTTGTSAADSVVAGSREHASGLFG